jgi:hypothetical protein
VRPAASLNIAIELIASEPGNSFAILRLPDGATEVCRVGQRCEFPGGQFKVTGIEPGKVTVEMAGNTVELVLEQEK